MKPDQALLQNAAVLAQLLERLEQSPGSADALQFRLLAQCLAHALEDAQAGGHDLNPLLQQVPAAAEVYENLQYPHAGLCRSPQPSALAAEVQAAQAIAKARGTVAGSAHPQA